MKRIFFSLLIMVMSFSISSSTQATQEIASQTKKPSKFVVLYEFSAGTMPPPYFYSYTISLQDEAGLISYMPNYPDEDVPVWTEKFSLTQDLAKALYQAMKTLKELQPTSDTDGPQVVGGSQHTLTYKIYGDAKTFQNSQDFSQNENLKSLRMLIKKTVPDTIWEKLRTQKEAYEKSVLNESEDDNTQESNI